MTRYAYRLRAWPELPASLRTAPVLRTLSRMTCGPVTHNWFLDATRMQPAQAEALLANLIAHEYVERIDFAAAPENLPTMNLAPATDRSIQAGRKDPA